MSTCVLCMCTSRSHACLYPDLFTPGPSRLFQVSSQIQEAAGSDTWHHHQTCCPKWGSEQAGGHADTATIIVQDAKLTGGTEGACGCEYLPRAAGWQACSLISSWSPPTSCEVLRGAQEKPLRGFCLQHLCRGSHSMSAPRLCVVSWALDLLPLSLSFLSGCHSTPPGRDAPPASCPSCSPRWCGCDTSGM